MTAWCLTSMNIAFQMVSVCANVPFEVVLWILVHSHFSPIYSTIFSTDMSAAWSQVNKTDTSNEQCIQRPFPWPVLPYLLSQGQCRGRRFHRYVVWCIQSSRRGRHQGSISRPPRSSSCCTSWDRAENGLGSYIAALFFQCRWSPSSICFWDWGCRSYLDMQWPKTFDASSHGGKSFFWLFGSIVGAVLIFFD